MKHGIKYARRAESACVLFDEQRPGWAVINPMPRLFIPAVRAGDIIYPLAATGPGPVTYWFGSEMDAWALIDERRRDAGEAISPNGD